MKVTINSTGEILRKHSKFDKLMQCFYFFIYMCICACVYMRVYIYVCLWASPRFRGQSVPVLVYDISHCANVNSEPLLSKGSLALHLRV